jgi:hypothetical protein
MRPWIVLPHDPIERLDDDLWIVKGVLPRGGVQRRMMIARLADRRLVFLNAIPLREDAMREVESFGTPAFLVVPNGLHRLDIAAFKLRYPALRVLAGARSAKRIGRVVPVDGGFDELPSDPKVRIERIEGTKIDEPLAVVGDTLCIPGDAMMNMPHQPGIGGLLFRLLGSTGGPRVTKLARWLVVGEPAKLRAHLLRLAQIPGLRRIVPCHGRVIRDRAPEVLREVAATL